jgi:hypothetical protein
MRSFRTTFLIFAECVAALLYADAQTQTLASNEQSQNQSSSSPTNSSSPSDDRGWRLDLSPYLWFAGTHGTVGALGRDASVHASAWDLLSHFNFGLMGASEARFNRFVLNGDLLWIRLSDSAALPFPGLNATSVDVRVGQLVWTSKVGYRLIDKTKFKADSNLGVRYWHLGQKLTLNPSIPGLNVNTSQSWADIVVGGRVDVPFSRNLSLTALGDVGGWDATAKLDYQFAALLNLKISPRWTISPGYRYLFVDYRSGNSVYSMVTPGAVIGLSYTIGGNRGK